MLRQETVKRTKVIVSSGLGLGLCLLVTACAILIHHLLLPLLPPLLRLPFIAWGVFLFFLALALLEIPLMIYGLRKVSEGKSDKAAMMTLLGNGVFVSFPVVYSLPNLLLTNTALIWLGVLIAATSLLRFTGSILFLPRPQKT
jgi:hypothetical protein